MSLRNGTYVRPFDKATVILDLETTIRNRGELAIGSVEGSPFDPNNKIVLLGYIPVDFEPYGPEIYSSDDTFESVAKHPWGNYLFVGHNIKFDILHLMASSKRFGKDPSTWATTNIFWDTMIVEYLLTGQRVKFASLDALATKYGGTLKDTRIKELWDAGVDTSDIPKELLTEYLKSDLANTLLIYKKQFERAVSMPGMLDLIKRQMDMLRVTILMEWNGMHIDIHTFNKDMEKLLVECNTVEDELHSKIVAAAMRDINIDSPKQLSTLLYGGKFFDEIDVELLDKFGRPVVYKSGKKKGKLKTRKETVATDFPGLITGSVRKELKTLSTDVDTLKELLTKSIYTYVKELIVTLLKYRELTKQFNTYYVGVGNLIWPHDDCIHGNLHLCGTNTGRLSSSAPNLQNLPSYGEE